MFPCEDSVAIVSLQKPTRLMISYKQPKQLKLSSPPISTTTTALPRPLPSSLPPAFSQNRSQKSNSDIQERIQSPFASQPLVKLEPNNRDARPSDTHVRDEVGMRSERTESVM